MVRFSSGIVNVGCQVGNLRTILLLSERSTHFGRQTGIIYGGTPCDDDRASQRHLGSQPKTMQAPWHSNRFLFVAMGSQIVCRETFPALLIEQGRQTSGPSQPKTMHTETVCGIRFDPFSSSQGVKSYAAKHFHRYLRHLGRGG